MNPLRAYRRIEDYAVLQLLEADVGLLTLGFWANSLVCIPGGLYLAFQGSRPAGTTFGLHYPAVYAGPVMVVAGLAALWLGYVLRDLP